MGSRGPGEGSPMISNDISQRREVQSPEPRDSEKRPENRGLYITGSAQPPTSAGARAACPGRWEHSSRREQNPTRQPIQRSRIEIGTATRPHIPGRSLAAGICLFGIRCGLSAVLHAGLWRWRVAIRGWLSSTGDVAWPSGPHEQYT